MSVDWMYLAQNRDYCEQNTVIILWLLYEPGDFMGTGIIINFPQDMPRTYNVILCRFQAIAVKTMPSFLIFVHIHVTVNSIKPSTVVMETQEWVHFALLSELQNISYCFLQHKCS